MIFNMIASGGGASAPRFGIATGTPTSSQSTSLSFTNLLGEPQAFCVVYVPKGTRTWEALKITANTYLITSFVYDGVEISTCLVGNYGSGVQLYAYGNGYNAKNNAYSFVYSSGTLTISRDSTNVNNGSFYSYDDSQHDSQYELLYIY